MNIRFVFLLATLCAKSCQGKKGVNGMLLPYFTTAGNSDFVAGIHRTPTKDKRGEEWRKVPDLHVSINGSSVCVYFSLCSRGMGLSFWPRAVSLSASPSSVGPRLSKLTPFPWTFHCRPPRDWRFRYVPTGSFAKITKELMLSCSFIVLSFD